MIDRDDLTELHSAAAAVQDALAVLVELLEVCCRNQSLSLSRTPNGSKMIEMLIRLGLQHWQVREAA
jgi:hypothetical protein